PERQGPDMIELARLRALLAPAFHQLAVGVQLRDPLVIAEFGDVIKPVCVLNHVADVAELPRRRPDVAAEFPQLVPVGIVNAETMIMGIADDQMPVAIDPQTARPSFAKIGRRPSWAEVFAVRVVNLNARGVIDDVEPVLRVNGDGPRPHDVAGL